MSTINASSVTDTRLAGSDLESLRNQASFDQLRGNDAGFGVADGGIDALPQQDADGARLVQSSSDSGEDVLNASAWSGVADGERLLSGDTGFEALLDGMELSHAADSAADAVFDALF